MSVHRHFAIFKPYGYDSQFVLVTNKKKKLLGELYDFPENTMAIGRLDKPSEGLLLLTTDGMMSQTVRSKKVEKEYYVQVDGLIDDTALERLSEGVIITVDGEPYTTLSCPVRVLNQTPILPPRAKKIRDDRHGPTTWISISLREGKFRQIRKMTAAVGFPTLRLVRVRIGPIHIGNMQAGSVIEMDNFGIGIGD